jgi:AraC-like DNA-binding protein
MSYACSLDSTAPWRPRLNLERWECQTSIPRHRHVQGYAALVVSGGYEECGGFGRFQAREGQVLLHRPFDAHLDRFVRTGARILSLPLRSQPVYGLGRVADPDRILHIASKDLIEASELLFEQLRPVTPNPADWPDLLASDLISDPTLQLRAWAERQGLAQESLARGFRKVFAITPAAFRAEARAQSAWVGIGDGAAPLAHIAEATGFADQAHMTRAISELTGCPPGYWRRLNRFKTPPVTVT